MRDDEGFLIRHFAGAVCYHTVSVLHKPTVYINVISFMASANIFCAALKYQLAVHNETSLNSVFKSIVPKSFKSNEFVTFNAVAYHNYC